MSSPREKKAKIRSQIDLPNEESHCATVKVRLECAGEMSAVDCLGARFVYVIIITIIIIIIIIILHLSPAIM